MTDGVVGQAVGNGSTSTLIEHWDGATWTQISSPNSSNELSAVSASSASNTWAAGSYQDNSTSAQLAFAIHCCYHPGAGPGRRRRDRASGQACLHLRRKCEPRARAGT